MTTFVLVHGGFGSPAELAPVIPELEELGHRAIAVDLPCPDPKAMLEDYARTVVEAMAGIEGPIVVVGHSAGGATISLVPGMSRVDRLVYVTAFVPEPGRSIADLIGAEGREMILAVSRDDGNGCRSFDLELLASIVPPAEREAYLAFLEATQRPQGWAAMEQPWPGDNILPPATQRGDGGAPRRGARRASPRATRCSRSGRASSHAAGRVGRSLPDVPCTYVLSTDWTRHPAAGDTDLCRQDEAPHPSVNVCHRCAGPTSAEPLKSMTDKYRRACRARPVRPSPSGTAELRSGAATVTPGSGVDGGAAYWTRGVTLGRAW